MFGIDIASGGLTRAKKVPAYSYIFPLAYSQ